MKFIVFARDTIDKIPIAIIAIFLSVITSLYLINNYGVVNYYFVKINYADFNHSTVANETDFYFKQLLLLISKFTNLNLEISARLLMIICHAAITCFVILIGKKLELSKLTLWLLLFLLLSQSSYNNFRAYIIAEPIYWALWLCSLYILIAFYKQNVVLVVIIWCFGFLIAGFFNLSAWFWLVFFPFGALFWRKWRTKPVYYALIGYVLFVCIILSIPIFGHSSIFDLFSNTFSIKYKELQSNIQSQHFNWLKEDNNALVIVYILSGGLSLVILKTLMSLGIANAILLFIALSKKRIKIISQGKLRFIIYIIIFSMLSSLMTSLLQPEKQSVGYFSIIFILLIFSATGLSYVFQKVNLGRYQKVTVLVLAWCIVAYIASGFINFGPSKVFIKEAGQNSITIPNLYSENLLFLYYAKHTPESMKSLSYINILLRNNPNSVFYFGYELNRKRSLPTNLEHLKVVATYNNAHQDKFIIFKIDKPIYLQ